MYRSGLPKSSSITSVLILMPAAAQFETVRTAFPSVYSCIDLSPLRISDLVDLSTYPLCRGGTVSLEG